MIHRAMLKRLMISLPPQSHPLGDWMPWNMDVQQRETPVTVIWEPGFYGDLPSDKLTIEMCTGSQPGHFHARLVPQERDEHG